jgi:RimJ/RimL family protein N-acetyltransferase
MIATARLRLRPFSPEDAPRIFALSEEEGLRRWLPDQVYRDQAHAAEVVAALAAHAARGPDPRARPYVLAIEHAGRVVGHVGLSPARGSVEIGYAVELRLQGQGLATEAVTALSGWGLTALGLAEILGIVAADNLPSRRVLEKSGFVRDAGVDPSAMLVHRRVVTT